MSIQDDATLLAQANLLAPQAPALPPAEPQGNRLSIAAESQLRTQFNGVAVGAAQLSYDYRSYNSDATGNVGTLDDAAGNPQAFIAYVNQNKLPNDAELFGLPAGQIDANGRSQPNTLLDAVAAEEVAQKIVQSSPQLQGMPKQNEELIGEAALLNAMPEAYSRTLLRTSNILSGQASGTDYNGIANQTVSSMQNTLNAQGHSDLNAGDLLRDFDAYTVRNGAQFTGLPNQNDRRGPYEDAFQEYFRSVGIQDVGGFQQALQTTMQQDFDTAGRRMIADQVQVNQSAQIAPGSHQPQTMAPEPARADITAAGAPGNALYEQAYAGIRNIGSEKLGLGSDQEARNVAAALTREGVGQNFNQFAMVVPGGNGKVFGLDSDPQTNPGHKHVNVDVAYAATLSVERISDDVQKQLQQQPTQEQPSHQREPRGMGMA